MRAKIAGEASGQARCTRRRRDSRGRRLADETLPRIGVTARRSSDTRPPASGARSGRSRRRATAPRGSERSPRAFARSGTSGAVAWFPALALLRFVDAPRLTDTAPPGRSHRGLPGPKPVVSRATTRSSSGSPAPPRRRLASRYQRVTASWKRVVSSTIQKQSAASGSSAHDRLEDRRELLVARGGGDRCRTRRRRASIVPVTAASGWSQGEARSAAIAVAREGGGERDVEADPGDVVVVGDVARRERERQPQRPRDEKDRRQLRAWLRAGAGRGGAARSGAGAMALDRSLRAGRAYAAAAACRCGDYRCATACRGRHHRVTGGVSPVVISMLRLERHRLGPRVFVFGRRIHEWHLGRARRRRARRSRRCSALIGAGDRRSSPRCSAPGSS